MDEMGGEPTQGRVTFGGGLDPDARGQQQMEAVAAEEAAIEL